MTLNDIAESVYGEFEALHNARETALETSRLLTRNCAKMIRAIHRLEWDELPPQLDQIRDLASTLQTRLVDFPAVYHAGYTQDALKEYAEALLTYHLVHEEALLTPKDLDIPANTYINGLVEAATELRRHILDCLRRDETQKAERLLEQMDDIYMAVMALDFPDAVTGGLRRRTDILRNVLERTRGDLTLSLRQHRLEHAIKTLDDKLT